MPISFTICSIVSPTGNKSWYLLQDLGGGLSWEVPGSHKPTKREARALAKKLAAEE